MFAKFKIFVETYRFLTKFKIIVETIIGIAETEPFCTCEHSHHACTNEMVMRMMVQFTHQQETSRLFDYATVGLLTAVFGFLTVLLVVFCCKR